MSKSSTTTDDEQLPNPSPGGILRLDFLNPARMTSSGLARALHVPPRRILDILRGRRAINADTDLRLARYYGLTPGFFLGLQAEFDLLERRRQIGEELKSIEPRAA